MTNNPVLDWLVEAVREYPEMEAPVTYTLVGVITGVFIVEVGMTLYLSLSRIQVFSTGVFGVYPWLAWPAAPFMHRGVPHFVGSIFGLVVLGLPLERHWSRWKYIGFLVVSGYFATAAGAVFMLLFADQQIAFYGTSGIVYALAGFALTHLLRSHTSLTRIEWIAVLMGVISLASVVIDPFIGPYFNEYWINGGHISGFVLGALVGWFSSMQCWDYHDHVSRL